jgi:hypothetical protein
MAATNANSLWSSPRTKTITTFGGNDKKCNDDTFTHSRRIRAGATGNLIVNYTDSAGANQQDTIVVAFAGETFELACISIDKNSTCLPITIFY